MNTIFGKNAGIGYDPANLNKIYFDTDGQGGLIEIKTMGVALGILGILSLTFLPIPLGLIGAAAGCAAIYFSITIIGNIKSANELEKIDHKKNVQENGSFKGVIKTATQGANAAWNITKEVIDHGKKLGEAALNPNMKWFVFRNL